MPNVLTEDTKHSVPYSGKMFSIVTNASWTGSESLGINRKAKAIEALATLRQNTSLPTFKLLPSIRLPTVDEENALSQLFDYTPPSGPDDRYERTSCIEAETEACVRCC